ncbi:ras-related protein Rab-31-like isoform X2 [Diorhabda sublineata]|uniref:ras-related protein Rab-31-like isoform X2 n=1 Tax=Diorhabda sublineata TaxID=1163346 RepID=UPI0024E05DC0|nr:ras-related protein Rab-31-like isoform X2 [Diorhabda sublineata]
MCRCLKMLWGITCLSVGKTATVTRYVEKSFSQQTAPTVGASFFTCKVNTEDHLVTLQIWDTAGQERFKAMAPMFYRNANAALLVFDITSQPSFESIKMWVQELKGNVYEQMVLCVVGNKIDLNDQRQVTREEALAYANSINAIYLESSAKTDYGIGMVFEKIAQGLLRLQGLNSTLKVFEDDMMAKSSELEPTDTAKEETVNISIKNIAHGDSVNRNGCC